MSVPFIEAVRIGDINLVKQFHEKGADVNQSKNNENPLSVAIKEKGRFEAEPEISARYEEIIDFLLENGADPNGPAAPLPIISD